jgi:hypothetical protein
LQHQRLFEREDVQSYCLDLLTGQRTARSSPPSTGAANQPVPRVEDYVAMARAIMAKAKTPARRGVVLSITRLEAACGPPLVDTSTEPSNSPARRRLTNPPAHLSSRDVFEVDSPRSVRFRYVLVHSNEGEAGYPIGGFLFLPAPTDRHIYLATFNVGPMDARFPAQCKNGHHAEIQLTRFVEHQPPAWRRRLSVISISNRSRRLRTPGFSPCNPCCDDLAKFLDALHALKSPSRISGTISWEQLYAGGGVCRGHPTDDKGLGMLKGSGWGLPSRRLAMAQGIAVGHRHPTPIGSRPLVRAAP